MVILFRETTLRYFCVCLLCVIYLLKQLALWITLLAKIFLEQGVDKVWRVTWIFKRGCWGRVSGSPHSPVSKPTSARRWRSDALTADHILRLKPELGLETKHYLCAWQGWCHHVGSVLVVPPNREGQDCPQGFPRIRAIYGTLPFLPHHINRLIVTWEGRPLVLHFILKQYNLDGSHASLTFCSPSTHPWRST